MDENTSFVDRVQALPAELLDEIFELTFTLEPDTCVSINKSYEPPAYLQVNTALRQQLTHLYYAQNIFIFCSVHDVRMWLNSLSRSNLRVIKRLRYDKTFTIHPQRDKVMSILAGRREQEVLDQVEAFLAPHMSLPENEITSFDDPRNWRPALPEIEIPLRFEERQDPVWTSSPYHFLKKIADANMSSAAAKWRKTYGWI